MYSLTGNYRNCHFPVHQVWYSKKNILIADEIVFSHPYDAFSSMPNNIFHSRLGVVTHETVMIYTPVDYLPYPTKDGTILADPMFIDWENGNFGFKSGSPAVDLGIKAIDISTAGIIKE